MKLNKYNVFNLVAATGLLIFTACSTNNDHKKNEEADEQAKDINEEKFEGDQEKDADRLVKAFTCNLFEIRASEQAAMRATTVDVKKLAGMLVVSHNKINTDLQALATRKNITLPADITDEQRRDLEDLGNKNSFEYDKEYARQMKKGHDDAVDLFEKTADKSEDPEIKQWAASVLPEIKSHKEMADATLEKVKDLKQEDRQNKKEKNTWDGKSDLHDGKEDHHDKK
jgi:putative membrane protein